MVDFTTFHIVSCPDGSRTLAHQEEALAFRSLRGAQMESQHVFVESSRLGDKVGTWNVLELGLGTGMNFVQTCQAFLNTPAVHHLKYHVVEACPIPPSLGRRLWQAGTHSLPHQLLLQGLDALALQTKPAPTTIVNKPTISLTIHPMPWQEAEQLDLQADAYYHDPFAPPHNLDCWTKACFQWAQLHFHTGTRLVTYAAATRLRRAMAESGLFVAKHRGACGKREMTIAAQSPESLLPYTLLPANKQPSN